MSNISGLQELAKMALRNLARHKVKTFLSILAITVSVALYILVDGWVVGMMQDSQRNIVCYETGAAKLQEKAYFEKLDDLPMYESFTDWEKYADALSAAGYASAPRFAFTGTLYSQDGTAPVTFYGVDPEIDPEVMRIDKVIDAGRYIKRGEYAIILGNMTADKLGVGLPMRPLKTEFENDILPIIPESERDFVRGLYEESRVKKQAFASEAVLESLYADRLVLKHDISQADKDRYWALLADVGRMDVQISTSIDYKDGKTADGEDRIRHVYQLMSAVVVGTINAPNPKLNNNMAFMPLDVLQDENGLMLNGAVTELVIRAKNADDAKLPGTFESPQTIANALLDAGDLPSDMGVFGWEGYVQDYIASSTGDNWSTRIMIIILFILSFLGIANTMLLAILERTKEIGMMRAQGMSDGQLIFMMMAEAGMLGLIGSCLGVLIGVLVNIPLVKYGIDMTAMAESMNGDIGYRVNGIFKSAWNMPVIIGSGIVATLLSALMAFSPTRRALDMPITESLRFE